MTYQTAPVDLESVGFGPQYKSAKSMAFTGIDDSPFQIPIDPGYAFDNIDAMRLMVQVWNREWERPEARHRKGIFFFGPTGSGKSTLLEQFFARLKVPLVCTTWNPKREADEMVSSKTLVDGCLLDRPQAIAIAARNGFPLKIDEIDLADPAELVSLNDLIEKGVISLPNGETFTAKRGFVVYATANANGTDDEAGIYHGTRSLNASTLRRFFPFPMGYPSEEQEATFLRSIFPSVSDQFLKAVSKVAVKIRQCFEGTSDGKRLSAPISRPEVIDWVEMMGRFAYLKSKNVNVAAYTMQFCFSNRLPAGDQETIRLIIENNFSASGTP